MKKVVIAAVAALFAFAVQAADVAKTMTAEECKTAIEACGTDQACKDNLVKENGCKAEAAK